MKNLFIYLFIFASLVACSKGPSGDELQKQIEVKLEKDFKSGLFKVKSFSRRGSYSYKEFELPEPRLLLYFKTELEFQEDYVLTDWNTLSVGSLSYILGATTSGIEGVKAEGNKKGDTLTIFGTANFKEVENKWVSIAPKFKELKGKGSSKKKYVSEIDEAAEIEKSNLPSYKKSLVIMNKIFARLDQKNDKETIQVAEVELQKVLRKARMYSAMKKGVTTLATGSPIGNYYALGRGLAGLNNSKHKTKAFASSGSVENCHLVNDKEVTFAIVQSDIAKHAYKGREMFEDSIPMGNLRAVAALYPEAIMIVTRKKDHYESIFDLKGKRISIGIKGSGHRADAIQIIKAHGLDESKFKSIKETNLVNAVSSLQNGDVDAIFVTAGYPIKALENLNQKTPINILSLDQKIISKMVKTYPLIGMIIPSKTYNGQTKKVHTVGVTSMLVTHKDTSKEDVQRILDSLLNNSGVLAKSSAQANYISKRSIRRGVTIPLHNGAR